MKINMKKTITGLGLVFLIILFIASAGCIKQVQGVFNGDSGSETGSTMPVSTETNIPSESISDNTMPTLTPTTVTPTPLPFFRVDEVDPYPYITPDPYRLPYRNFSNQTGNATDRSVKIPQFSRTIILRSNATAFWVNVTKGPFVIDLTFSPLFDIPDQTGDTGSSYPSDDDEDSEESSGESSGKLSGSKSYVYSNAEILVINAYTNETTAAEGYGGIYSSDIEKTIKIYKESPYIVALKGNFIDVDIKITTSSPELPATLAPDTNTPYMEEEDW